MSIDPKDAQVSVRLPIDLKARMESYARVTGRNKSHVVMEAVADYLAWRTPQVEDLQLALQEADSDAFASDAEVAAVFARHLGKTVGTMRNLVKAPVTTAAVKRRAKTPSS